MAPLALVRPPVARLAEGLVTHIDRRPVDVDRARAQWAAYRAAFSAAGWEVDEVAPAEDCPDSVFVEDTVVLFDDLAVVTRPGAPSRRPEVEAVAPVVRDLGLEVARIEAPGTLEGGDVLKVGRTVYVGAGGRSDGEGIRQLRALLAPRGLTVVGVPVRSVLHLKSGATALPDGTVVGHAPLVDSPELFPRFLPVPEPSGAHVVLLDDEHLLLAADCPRTADLYASLGYVPVPVDIGEYQKLEGCVTCLSVRVRGGRR